MAAHPDKAGPFFYVLQDSVRILFVDDDPILREFAIVNLTSEQASVETAPDGAAALEAVAANPPDLMLLDLEMPNLDGFQVLEALRADERFAALPIIVVTGREDIEAVDRAFQAGATSFVVKPLNWRLLSYQVRYAHRTACIERQMIEARDETAAEAEELAAQLQGLAAESTRFLAQALALNPDLKPAAVSFAKAADAVLKPRDAAEAA
ncbi:MAG: PleD family two-component system response regulator [Caulobacterales bacterium]